MDGVETSICVGRDHWLLIAGVFCGVAAFSYILKTAAGAMNPAVCVLFMRPTLSFLVEQAGGLATDGEQDILDIQPIELHQRVPLIFGSADEVKWYKSN